MTEAGNGGKCFQTDVGRSGLIAGKPAPTGSPLLPRATLYLWELACQR